MFARVVAEAHPLCPCASVLVRHGAPCRPDAASAVAPLGQPSPVALLPTQPSRALPGAECPADPGLGQHGASSLWGPSGSLFCGNTPHKTTIEPLCLAKSPLRGSWKFLDAFLTTWGSPARRLPHPLYPDVVTPQIFTEHLLCSGQCSRLGGSVNRNKDPCLSGAYIPATP